MRSYKEDCEIGFQSENDILPTLNECFNDTFIKQTRYHSMDFEGSTCWIEVKTRPGVSSTTYPDMMLNMSKVLFALHAKKPVYFVFVLTDGIFYSKYDTNKYFYYRSDIHRREDRQDITDHTQRYIYIPVSDLDWIVKYEP